MGIANPEQAVKQLEKEVENRLSPPIKPTIDIHKFKGKSIIRVLVPKGDETPYALDDYKIYVRDENETNIAVRDEIVTLVTRSHDSLTNEKNALMETAPISLQEVASPSPSSTKIESDDPRTGVEVIESVARGGKNFYTMRDLRNGNIVKNVTQASARRLWHYAITKYDEITQDKANSDIQWRGNYGLVKQYTQGKNPHFDFILKTETENRYFFGVTPDGIHGNWKEFLSEEE